MKSVQFDLLGEPSQVLSIRDVEIPQPGPGQIRVKVHTANINPSDLMYIRGMYGIPPRIPQVVPGFEAMGTVSAVGEGVSLPIGMRIIFVHLSGTWQEEVIISAQQAIPAPKGLSDEVACQAFVNPLTAHSMLETSGLTAGDWLLLTAGGSAFGRYAIQMAKARGINTIVTVRRPDMVDSLKALGANVVVNTAEESNWTKTIYKATGDRKGVQSVFEAVGGETGAKALTTLATGGTCYCYGMLSLQDMPVNNGLLIFKDITIKGYWLSSWMAQTPPDVMGKVIGEVLGGLASQALQSEIEATYPLDEIGEAVTHAERPGRTGKILLDLR